VYVVISRHSFWSSVHIMPCSRNYSICTQKLLNITFEVGSKRNERSYTLNIRRKFRLNTQKCQPVKSCFMVWCRKRTVENTNSERDISLKASEKNCCSKMKQNLRRTDKESINILVLRSFRIYHTVDIAVTGQIVKLLMTVFACTM
jgi:hypothetical protein